MRQWHILKGQVVTYIRVEHLRDNRVSMFILNLRNFQHEGIGSSTNAWASESGLSSTMAMSISPSCLMRAVLPSCILFKIATALFSQSVPIL